MQYFRIEQINRNNSLFECAAQFDGTMDVQYSLITGLKSMKWAAITSYYCVIYVGRNEENNKWLTALCNELKAT